MTEKGHEQDIEQKITKEVHPEISVVVPLLNEQDNIGPLHLQITEALTGKYNYEIIFIDDGSSDNSLAVLTRVQKQDSRVRIICFRKNFGQTAALSAGFAHARGEIIVAIDADLQNDPNDIPKMIAKLEEGCDVVSGWRKKRHDNVLTRLLPSRICLLYTSPSPRDRTRSRMPSSA